MPGKCIVEVIQSREQKEMLEEPRKGLEQAKGDHADGSNGIRKVLKPCEVKFDSKSAKT